jgi:regulator of sigma E protease
MEELVRAGITIILFFAILGGLVLVHEFGHFLTARLAGVRVLEFGIGFPPRAAILRSKGETLYTLNWLPIGGFVKLEGEDGDNADDPRSFSAAPLPIRLGILAAGVVMNLATAFLIFVFIFWLATPLLGARLEVEPDPGSPAARVGLHKGDGVRAVDGETFEFRGADIVDRLREKAGQTVVLTVDRANGDVEEVTVTLRPPEQLGPNVGPLGIGIPTGYFYDGYVGHDLGRAIGQAARETTFWFGLILAGLGDLVGGFVNNPAAAPPVSGPVGIATQIGDIFFNAGPILTLYVAAVLSANLALVNSLPFPPLDGGRALMIVLKSAFGSRISLRAERLTYVVGFVVLFGFLIWVTGFDILRILGGST